MGPLLLRVSRSADNQDETRLLSPPSAFLVCDMLSNGIRPDLPASWEFTLRRSKVAFKTGTSFGFKDAWCAAVTPRWTVVVWLGNVGGGGNTALIGAKAAAPAAFEIVTALTGESDDWFKPPTGVGRRMVCRLTGRPPGPECPETEEDWFIPGVSRTDTCPVHKRVWIRKKDGVEVCLRCMTGKPSEYESRRWEVWPPEIAGFLRTQGKRYQPLPPHNPDCPAPPERPAPRIVSPEAGARYVLTKGLPRDAQRLALSAQASPDVKRLFWFVGEKPLGSVRPDGVIFWAPEPGDRVVSVLDSAGRSTAVTIRVDNLDSENP
jgi:penicillin-binding protein 1C